MRLLLIAKHAHKPTPAFTRDMPKPMFVFVVELADGKSCLLEHWKRQLTHAELRKSRKALKQIEQSIIDAAVIRDRFEGLCGVKSFPDGHVVWSKEIDA